MRGVALLRLEPPRPNEAIQIYEKLVHEAPQVPAYAGNLFAAKTIELTHGRLEVEPTQDETDALRELLAFGESLLSAFTEKQRAAVLMHKYRSMDYREIAAVLKLSESATKSLLFRAYEALRERLKEFV